MTPWCYLSLPFSAKFPKFGPHLHWYSHPQWCNSVRVHPYAHPQHMKVLKHFQYIQYECKKQSEVVYSIKHVTMMLFELNLTPNFPKFDPTCTGVSVTVYPYAHPQHMKMFKNFPYIQYGCEIQIWVVYRLKHDTMMLFGHCYTPKFPKFGPHPHW